MFGNLNRSQLLTNTLVTLDESLHIQEHVGSARDGIGFVRDGARKFLAVHNQGWARVKLSMLPPTIACGLAGYEPGVGIALGVYALMVIAEGVLHRPSSAPPEAPVSVPDQLIFYGLGADGRPGLRG